MTIHIIQPLWINILRPHQMTDTYHITLSLYCHNSNISLNHHYWQKQEWEFHIDMWLNGLVQKKHDSSANTLELYLTCTNISNMIYLNCYLVTSQIHWNLTPKFQCLLCLSLLLMQAYLNWINLSWNTKCYNSLCQAFSSCWKYHWDGNNLFRNFTTSILFNI